MNKQAAIYADEIEFYHDQGGLMTSKQDILDGTKKTFGGKVTRELLQEASKYTPFKDFGAVEIGLHKFHNNQNLVPFKKSVNLLSWQLTNENGVLQSY
jgi:hypothetical protein